jgi:hypothetical protein
MLQAVLLRDTIAAAGLDDPWEFACSFHQATAQMVEPWYRDTLAADRHRLAEIDALIGGGEYRPGDPAGRSARPLPLPPSRIPTACGASSASPCC